MGLLVCREHRAADEHPALAWVRSGAMTLTGRADGPPQMCPFPLASCVDGALAAFNAVSGATTGCNPTATILSERAALAGLRRNGAISASGSTRLLRAADGWIAVSLARQADWELVPAWLDGDYAETWPRLAALISRRAADVCVERGRLLGLAVASAVQPNLNPAPWFTVIAEGEPADDTVAEKPPLVVDLTSLWAGPLCTHLLQRAGAQVIKVESLQRPDGARNGSVDFFDLLNGGKLSVALDLRTPMGIHQLRQLLHRADIVIEASRPRALQQLGIDSRTIVAERKGLTWLSITGHGWAEPQGNWIAYGDDAGVAAGLSGALLDLVGEPMFCGDAIADPIAGVHAALLALASHRGGGGRLLAISLREVLSHCIRFALPDCGEKLHDRWRDWQRIAQVAAIPDSLPAARRPAERARALGADTFAVLADWGIRC
ncbi:MAG: CoA transferase [Sterolibacterium sp.]